MGMRLRESILVLGIIKNFASTAYIISKLKHLKDNYAV